MRLWSAMILAGGRGRRLGGRVKPLLPVGGRTIIDRQLAMLGELGVTPALVTKDAAPFLGTPVEVVPDELEAGALGGLYTALVRAKHDLVLVLAGDMPFVSAPFVAHLMSLVGGHDAVVPRTGDRWHPLCAVYHRRAAPSLRSRIEQSTWRVTDALDCLDVRAALEADMAAFDPDGMLLLNVNTPDDCQRADQHAIAIDALMPPS